MTMPQLSAPILAVAAPLLAAVILPVLGRWKRALVFPVTLAALFFAFGASVATARAVAEGGPVEYYLGGWEPPWGIAFRVDGLGALLLLVVTFLPLVVGVYSKRSVLAELPDREVPFYSVFLLLVAGLAGIASTADLFNLYVFLEITSLASYALVSIGGGAAVVSAFRYVILGTIGAAFYLLSVGYFYSVTGTLNMADLARVLPDLYGSNTVLVGFVFFTVGMGIKMALFPLHAWLPGAYANAPSAVSALVAANHDEGRRLRRHPDDVLRLRAPLLHRADSGDGNPRLDGGGRDGDRLGPGDRAVGPETDARLLVGRPDRLHRARHRTRERGRVHRQRAAPGEPRVHEGLPVSGGGRHRLPHRAARESATCETSGPQCPGRRARSCWPASR